MPTVTPEQTQLTQHIGGVLSSGQPVSFLDAMQVVRRAQRTGEIGSSLIAALVALHDHPQSTRGTRDVLSDYLRGLQHRIAQQEALASRPIKLNDSGKVARAKAKSTLTVTLPKGAWQVREQHGPIKLEFVDAVNVADAHQSIVITLLRQGHAYVVLEERNTKGSKGHFELRLLAE